MAATKEPQARRKESASVPDLKAEKPHLINCTPRLDLFGMGLTLREGSKIARTESKIDIVMQAGAQKKV